MLNPPEITAGLSLQPAPNTGSHSQQGEKTAMRSPLRLIALCTVAALAAGCSKNDGPSPASPGNATSTAQCTNTIGNRVWYDANCNGIQDVNETTGPEGVTVTLRDCVTQVERTTTTDSTGAYGFTDVATGSYNICIAIPSGYKATLQDQGGDDSMDSDIDSLACTGCRDYDCATDDLNSDAGICVDTGGGECTNTVGNRVWFDTNCNGIQDKDETGGPEGIKVVLRNCDTQEARATATNSEGFYEFTDVPTGEYTICIEIPGGYVATREDEGSNDGVDSDINADGCMGCRVYECDKDNLGRDAGLCEKKDDRANATFGRDLVDSDDVTLGRAIDAPDKYGSLVFHAIAALRKT